MIYQPPKHPHDDLDYHELLKRDYPSFPIRFRIEDQVPPGSWRLIDEDTNVTELRPIERTGTGK